MKHAAFTLEAGNVHVLPVLHERLEFAQVAVEAFRRLKPTAVAVELPLALGEAFSRAVRRFPQVSGLRFRNRQGETVTYLIEPSDPLYELVRLGLSHRVPVHYLDLDLDDYPDHFEPLPDSYAVARIGHRRYVEAFLESPLAQRRGPEDERREAAMAARLTALSARADGPVLFACGLAHAQRIAQLVGTSDAQPLDRGPREGAVLFNVHPESCREVLGTWAYLGAAYERARAHTLGEPLAPEQSVAEEGARVLNLFEKLGTPLQPSRPASAASVPKPQGLPLDRETVLHALFREAGGRYETVTGESLKPYHRRVFAKFVRNWSRLHAQLQPDLFKIIVGARASVDDNFAYEMFQLATRWPWQKAQCELPTMPVSLADLGRNAEQIRFRPRQMTRRLRAMASRKKLGELGDWIQGFENPFSHCSYPPEDMALEHFSSYVQKKAKGVLSEENKRVEPFSTSLLDGVDMRETLRNWHVEGPQPRPATQPGTPSAGRLFVQELRKGAGAIGSVVVVFDEDRERYPWEMTWLGEVQEEGDMALFSTHPLQQVVGPGICRCEYGGFLLSYPPGRMSDIWGDPVFESAHNRAERLLMAGIDYCEQKSVAYVAKKPPRSELKSWAARFGKKIIYLPIGQFSPDTLKKLRVFHVLFGKEKRDFARDYIC